ncbi:hypothetical protein TRICI_002354 [Trichomonascus ciferrii]|uniref:Protein CMS1 n=1 Tax=Trichomonascus ciferrii TaxID=44093 RepID=A0A642V7A0_9ASCO|nr:hypothetical protein TRICI_002354 [Trichomonascus ciferrii]
MGSKKRAAPEADDLDDGLDYSFDNVADEDDSHLPTEEQLLEEDSNSEEEESKIPEDQSEKKEDKKRKKRKDEKLVQKKKQKTEDMVAEKKAVTNYSPDLLADFVASKLKKLNPDLSSLEINELSIKPHCFADTTGFSEPRKLINYPKFFKQYVNRFLGRKGRYVVIMSMSAIRACDAHRALQKMGTIKLIKKNSIRHDKAILMSSKNSIAVTTPGRIKKLMDEDVFQVDRVAAIVVDSSYLDPKNYHIWDDPDMFPVLKRLTESSKEPQVFLY